MNVLLVSGHPAQVHNFRLVREELLRHGHQVYWLTTPKDIAIDLLKAYAIPYTVLNKADKGLASKIQAMLHNLRIVFHFIRDKKIDIAISRTNPFVLSITFFLHVPHILVSDTEHASSAPIMKYVFNKLGSCAVVPDCFWSKMHKHEIRIPGNIEMFYCRPGRFHLKEPWELLDFQPGTRYAIVRFVKWDAYHDVSLIGGYTDEDKIYLVESLIDAGLRVLITSEADLPAELEQYRSKVPIERMHDVMACAELFIGESSSMASESVVLGTPAIYVDQVGRGYTDEEAREGLLYMFRPVPTAADVSANDKDFILGGRKESIEKAIEIASPEFDREDWKARHAKWMTTKFDCTGWLTWFIENYPESEKEWRERKNEVERNFKNDS